MAAPNSLEKIGREKISLCGISGYCERLTLLREVNDLRKDLIHKRQIDKFQSLKILQKISEAACL
jgi:hypothetical protein